MSNVATLKLLGTSDLSAISADLKKIAQEGKAAGPPLTSLTKQLDASSKSAATFGQKVKDFGSKFQSSIGSLSTLGGTVLNLSRQYQDLGDSQIRVDKTALKVSRTTEATAAAQGKLNDLTAKGVTSGAEYEKALLDVKQAQEAQTLAVTMNKEALEDQQRAQENFWIGLVPTVTSAGASIISVINDIGGTKGLGGLVSKFSGFKTALSGLFSGVTGAGSLATGLTGIGTAAEGSVTGLNGMTKATTGLGLAMKGMALSALPVAVAIAGVAAITKESGIVIHEITSIMKGDLLSAITSLEDLVNLFKTLGAVAGPMGAGFQALSNLKFGPKNISMADEVARIKKELQGLPQTITPIPSAFQSIDDSMQGVNNTIDSLVGSVLGLTQHANAATTPLNGTGTAIAGIGTAASTAAPSVDALGTSVNPLSGLIDLMTVSVQENIKAEKDFNTWTQNINTTLGQTPKAASSAGNALSQMAKQAQQAASEAQRASQLMNQSLANLARHQAGPAPRSRTGAAPAVHPIGGQVAGARNPNYRRMSNYQVATIIPKKKGAAGMHETVTKPTWILAGEAGDESVNISPLKGNPHGGGGGGGGGSRPLHLHIHLKGKEIAEAVIDDINAYQSIFK